ncbi:MAG: class I SAM-dependent methyltransferase [Candidatus Lokiarchaeota archaeon]|nr:class I SAM-dependent methyltransferase [Candidatus Lokiarchaeota archaeon]
MIDLTKYKKIFRDFASDVDFINEVINNLNLDKDSKILDVGIGMGAMSILLALNGFQVLTGEPEMGPEGDEGNHHDHHHEHNNEIHYESHEEHHGESWDDWRTSAKNLGVENQIRYQNFDVQKLTFANESFDGIFLYDTLQHVKNREKALNECVRVVKNDGIIVIIEWTNKQIEVDFKKYGFKIDYIYPRDFIDRADIRIEELNSEMVNVYLLRKK